MRLGLLTGVSAGEQRFDELAQAFVAERHSRRSALKLGIGALGALVAATLPGRAFGGAGGGNSACAHFCNETFSGSMRGRCKSEAAHGRGPCYECGPRASDPTRVLCGDVCCGTGQFCCGNRCVTCPANMVPNPTTCVCECALHRMPCGEICCGPGEICSQPGVCCLNPPSCTSAEECCNGYECASGGCRPTIGPPCGSGC